MHKHLATITPILTATVFVQASLLAAPATYKKQMAAAPSTSSRPISAANTPCIDENLCRAELRYRDPRGVGYNTGYTTLELFLTPNWQHDVQPFVDLRGHVFNDGKWAANAGLGARTPIKQGILGVNAYYDFRDASGISPNQVGVGLEGLSQWADIRINGSYPFSSKTNVSAPCFGGFSGNDAVADQEITAALPRIYGEVGAPVGWVFGEVDLYVGLGSYYLFSRDIEEETLGNAWGGKARISLKPYDALRLEGEITWDRIYGTRPQGAITVSLPLGPSNRRTKGASFTKNYAGRCYDPALQLARMTQPVYRDEIIPVEEKDHRFAINDTCCPSSKIYFVNNSVCNTGCGTFESPFATLSDALAKAKSGDVVYVFPGTGTSVGLDSGYQIPNGVRLIGSSTDFTLCCYTIPACTPCKYPVLSIDASLIGSAVLTLGQGNEIAGIQVSGGDLGIDMGAATNVFIRDSVFIGNQIAIGNLPGIDMAPGKKQILGNQFYSPTTAAVSLVATAPYQANIAGNIFSGGPGVSLLFPVAIPSTTSLAITGNQFTGITTSGNAVIGFPDLVNVSLTLSDNGFTGIAGGDPVDFLGNIEGSSITLSSNQFAGVTENGIAFLGASIGDASQVNCLSNCFSGVANSGVLVTSDLSNANLLFNGNSFTGAAQGISFTGLDLSHASVAVQNNCFTGVTLYGSNWVNVGVADSSILYTGNTFQGFAGNALFFSPLSTVTSSTLLVENNDFSAIAGTGLLLKNIFTNSTITVQNNSMRGFGADAILFGGSLTETTTLITTNCFQNVAVDAVGLAAPLTGGSFSMLSNAFNLIGHDALYSTAPVVGSLIDIEVNCLQGLSGTAFAFVSPTVNSAVTISCNQLDEISGPAISFCGEINGLTLTVANTSFADLNGPVIEICESVNANNLTFSVQDSSFTNIIGPAIEIDSNLKNSSVGISGNVFLNLSDDAVLLTGAIQGSTVDITSNIFSKVTDHAIALTGALSNSDTISIQSNCISSITSGGTLLGQASSGSAILFDGKIDAATISIAGNSMTNIEVDGVSFTDQIGTGSNITLQNNLLNLVGGNGFHVEGDLVGSSEVAMNFNVLENINGAGAFFEGINLNNSSIGFNFNSLNQIGGAGFSATSALNALSLIANQNNLQNISGDGFALTNTTGTAQNTIAITNNNLVSITGNGFTFGGALQHSALLNNNYLKTIGKTGFAFNGAVLDGSSLTLSANQATDVALQGVLFNSTITGSTIGATVVLDSNSFLNTGEEGILFNSSLRGRAVVSLSANELAAIGTAGQYSGISFLGDLNNFAGGIEYPNIDLNGNSIEGTSGHGLFFNGLVGGSSAGINLFTTITGERNMISNTGRSGIFFGKEMDGLLSFTGNSLNKLGDAGVFFNSDLLGPAAATVTFSKNAILGANQDGVCFNSAVGPQLLIAFDSNFLQNLAGNGIRFAGAVQGGLNLGSRIDFLGNNFASIEQNGIIFESTIGTESIITGIGNSLVNIGKDGISHLLDIDGGSSIANVTALNYSCNTFLNVGLNGVIFKGSVGTLAGNLITTRVCFNNNDLASIGRRGFQLGAMDPASMTVHDLRRGFLYADSNNFSGVSIADMLVLLESSTASVESNSFSNRFQVCAEMGLNCLTLMNNASVLPTNAYVIDVTNGVVLDVQPGFDQASFILNGDNGPAEKYMINNLGTVNFTVCPSNSLDACPSCE